MHPPNEELELYRLGRLSPGASSILRSHLSDCTLCASKLRRLSEPSQGQTSNRIRERRRHVRTPSDQPASITVVRPSPKPMSGRVLDVSEGGLKLIVSEPLEPGTLIQVRLANKFVLAEARYCLRQGEEFHVGIETKDVFEIPGKDESSSPV